MNLQARQKLIYSSLDKKQRQSEEREKQTEEEKQRVRTLLRERQAVYENHLR